jgi:hypothetical protein
VALAALPGARAVEEPEVVRAVAQVGLPQQAALEALGLGEQRVLVGRREAAVKVAAQAAEP